MFIPQLASVVHAAEVTGYPARPIRVIVAWSPGGATDVFARIVAEALSKELNQSVIVENRPGANGTIGQNFIASAAPDGYNVIISTNSTFAIAPHLYKDLPFKQTDFAPISLLGESPLVLVTKKTLNVDNVEDLIEYAKHHPGELNFSTGGSGSTSHLAAELFMSVTGTEMVHIPYKGGGPAAIAVATEQVDVAFLDLGVALPLLRSDRIVGLGLTGTRRSQEEPELKTLAEQGLGGFEVTTTFAMFAPSGIREEVGRTLSKAVSVVLSDNAIEMRLSKNTVQIINRGSADLANYVAVENQKWAKVIEERNIKI
ncbi:tripartite tricarboxylate transporter substrate binding protein [Pusillimonas sp. ANT_WB101]|uniref:Bug family tripartite tricarboxylate transporter substrate binding protein n=1 Tax=Pusillimonas sp. ANT_WB101 TaxID=2597356 RepID=UPI00165DAED5|nr:tripartite tricarboxylate transporter substrate binding protein [Pusillimonas sp. ANT_WB101]